mmetsp:Transcript_27484/g.80837  ORF Transcript_27484/g.80837 Transcript_27484/m.80837 type:complete len:202 (+) Transcript_27484:152-757(+)
MLPVFPESSASTSPSAFFPSPVFCSFTPITSSEVLFSVPVPVSSAPSEPPGALGSSCSCASSRKSWRGGFLSSIAPSSMPPLFGARGAKKFPVGTGGGSFFGSGSGGGGGIVAPLPAAPTSFHPSSIGVWRSGVPCLCLFACSSCAERSRTGVAGGACSGVTCFLLSRPAGDPGSSIAAASSCAAAAGASSVIVAPCKFRL